MFRARRELQVSDSLGSRIILSILSRTQPACPSHYTFTLGGFVFFFKFSALISVTNQGKLTFQN